MGEPKETDYFTLNLVSLTLSHVKVEVDLTKPLPSVVEFQRQNGEVVEVQVDYPWLPPTCSHCKELGHVMRNCLTYTPPKNPPSGTETATKQKEKAPINEPRKHASGGVPTGKRYVPVKKTVSGFTTGVSNVASTIPLSDPPPPISVSLPSSPSAVKINLFPNLFSVVPKELSFPSSHQGPSDKPPKLSLKRCRSSPSLSPPSHQKPSSTGSIVHLPLNFLNIGTLTYIKSSPFIHPPSVSNPFLPLQVNDSLQLAGDPTLYF